MGYAFSRSGNRKLGYNISQVDEFLNLAREQYTVSSLDLITSLDVRTIRFQLEKNGYSISAVDAALEKLEDVFASNEYSRELLSVGHEDFEEELTNLRSLVLARCARSNKKRFTRRIWPFKGYNYKQVDLFCSQWERNLESDAQLAVRDVRTATFKSKRGGYAEYQVDAFIEKAVELLQREQATKSSSR